MKEAKPAIHSIVTPFPGIGSIGWTAIVPTLIRMIHLVLPGLIFFDVHVTDTSLQRLGADR